MLNNSIFKAYDIRGVYPNDLDEKTAYFVGRAFGEYSRARKIVVGFDARLSSPQLVERIIAGINSQDIAVVNIGMCSAELIYFAVASQDFDAGIIVTASHNPKEYNGFKMVVKQDGQVNIIPGKSLLPFINEDDVIPINQDQNISSKNLLEDYGKYLFKHHQLKDVKRFKVVIDASNGVVGKIIDFLAPRLPIDIIKLNFNPDGNFPNHSPNPLELNAGNQITDAVKENNADFGLIFDADGDRVFLIDEMGNFVPADTTLLLLAKYFLRKEKNIAIAYNLICSKAVPEFIKKWGGKPVRTAVGFVNVQKGLRINKGVMGGELSGHYCFRDFFNMDSGIFAFLIVLEVLSQDKKKVSELVKELKPYFKTAINFEIQDKEKIQQKIGKKYKDGHQDFLDGITVEYSNWWFNARISNTEPLLRLTIEADTENLLKEREAELMSFINANK